MSQDAIGQLEHLKTARARWPFPDVGEAADEALVINEDIVVADIGD